MFAQLGEIYWKSLNYTLLKNCIKRTKFPQSQLIYLKQLPPSLQGGLIISV